MNSAIFSTSVPVMLFLSRDRNFKGAPAARAPKPWSERCDRERRTRALIRSAARHRTPSYNGGLGAGSRPLPNRGPPARQGEFAVAKPLALALQEGYQAPTFCPKAPGAAMARVTVEDCIDKVENRFDLVLLASHRARLISSGGQITIERDNDKNPVVSLREIAEKAISPEDLREEPVHSLQQDVEVEQPDPAAVPLIGATGGTVDADDTEVMPERMTEEELLKGLEGLAPPEEQPEEDE